MGVAVSDANKDGVYLWNVDPSMARFEEMDEKVECMASDPSGVLAVATEAKRIHFAKIHDGTAQASPYQGAKDGVKRMAFSPDGKRLAVGYEDGTIVVLGYVPPRPEELRTTDREESGKWLEMVTIPVSGVRGLEFGADGETLVALGARASSSLGAWK